MDPDTSVRSGFATTGAEAEGHGLGLPNVREAVAGYGGTLNLGAQDGRFEVSSCSAWLHPIVQPTTLLHFSCLLHHLCPLLAFRMLNFFCNP